MKSRVLKYSPHILHACAKLIHCFRASPSCDPKDQDGWRRGEYDVKCNLALKSL